MNHRPYPGMRMRGGKKFMPWPHHKPGNHKFMLDELKSDQNDENLDTTKTDGTAMDVSLPHVGSLQLSTPVKVEAEEKPVGFFPPQSSSAKRRVDESSEDESVTLRTESRSPSTMVSVLSTLESTPRTPTPPPTEPPAKLRRSSRHVSK